MHGVTALVLSLSSAWAVRMKTKYSGALNTPDMSAWPAPRKSRLQNKHLAIWSS